jgi:glutamine amidotransferase
MKTKTIAIIDYGMGNLKSVENAFHKVCDYTVTVTDKPQQILDADMILLPGVGAFPDAMDQLHSLDLVPVLNEAVQTLRKPTLGICLGMQLLCEASHEKQWTNGLGWIPGEVKLIEGGADLRVPHVGWNSLIVTPNDSLFSFLKNDRDYYFVHSYHVVCHPKFVLAEFEYEKRMVAAIKSDNVIGMQFHPEKSQKTGLQALRAFINWADQQSMNEVLFQ